MKRTRFFCFGGVAIALLWIANPVCYSADTEHADVKAAVVTESNRTGIARQGRDSVVLRIQIKSPAAAEEL